MPNHQQSSDQCQEHGYSIIGGTVSHVKSWPDTLACTAHQLTAWRIDFDPDPSTMKLVQMCTEEVLSCRHETQTRPEEDIETGLGQPWMVILFNDDYHAFDEVIAQVQKATGCSPGEAFQITYAAHTNGQAVAYVGDKPHVNRSPRCCVRSTCTSSLRKPRAQTSRGSAMRQEGRMRCGLNFFPSCHPELKSGRSLLSRGA